MINCQNIRTQLFICCNFHRLFGWIERINATPSVFSIPTKTLKLSDVRQVYHTYLWKKEKSKAKHGFADKLRFKSAAFGFHLLAREVVMVWKIDSKKILLSQNRVVCIVFFRYWKPALVTEYIIYMQQMCCWIQFWVILPVYSSTYKLSAIDDHICPGH